MKILFFDYDEKIESQRLLRRLYDSINIKLEIFQNVMVFDVVAFPGPTETAPPRLGVRGEIG